MHDMFEEAEAWLNNLGCCRIPPLVSRHGMHSSEWHGRVMEARMQKEEEDAANPWTRRCASTPEDHAQSITLRQEQHTLQEEFSSANKLYVHVFAVPSSHPGSFPVVVFRPISHVLDIHCFALCSHPDPLIDDP